jgi:hypothetical protein
VIINSHRGKESKAIPKAIFEEEGQIWKTQPLSFYPTLMVDQTHI